MSPKKQPEHNRGISRKTRRSKKDGAQRAGARNGDPSTSPQQATLRAHEQSRIMDGTITQSAPTRNGGLPPEDALLLHFAPANFEWNHFSQHNGARTGMPPARHQATNPTEQNGLGQTQDRRAAQFSETMGIDIPSEFSNLFSGPDHPLVPLPLDFSMPDCPGEGQSDLPMIPELNVAFGPSTLQGANHDLSSVRQLSAASHTQARLQAEPSTKSQLVPSKRQPQDPPSNSRGVGRGPPSEKATSVRGRPGTEVPRRTPAREESASQPSTSQLPPRFSENPAQPGPVHTIAWRNKYRPDVMIILRQDSDPWVKERLFKDRLASCNAAGLPPSQDSLSQEYLRAIGDMNALIILQYRKGCRSARNLEICRCFEKSPNLEYRRGRLVDDLRRMQQHVAANPRDRSWADEVVRQLQESIILTDEELLGPSRTRSSHHGAAQNLCATTAVADTGHRPTRSVHPGWSQIDQNDGAGPSVLRSRPFAGQCSRGAGARRTPNNDLTELLNAITLAANRPSDGNRSTGGPSQEPQGGVAFPSLPYLHDLLSKAVRAGHVPTEAGVAAVAVEPAAYETAAKTHIVTQHFLNRLLEEAEKLHSMEVAALKRAESAEKKVVDFIAQTRTLERELAILQNQDWLRQRDLKQDQDQGQDATKATILQLREQIDKDARTIAALTAKGNTAEAELKTLRQGVAKNGALNCKDQGVVSTGSRALSSSPKRVAVTSQNSEGPAKVGEKSKARGSSTQATVPKRPKKGDAKNQSRSSTPGNDAGPTGLSIAPSAAPATPANQPGADSARASGDVSDPTSQ